VLVTVKLLPQRLTCAGDSEAGWPDERWRSLAESAAVVLLVDSLLLCSLDASIVATDACVSEVCIFIHLSLGGVQTNGHWSFHGEH
jgi:hypothetical protein